MPKDAWLADMTASRESFISALDHVIAAGYEIKADPPERAGFSLSSSSNIADIQSEWGSIVDMISFEVKAFEEMKKALEDPTYTYIQAIDFAEFSSPFDYFAHYAYGNWPTTVEPGVSIGVNAGVLFHDPLAFAFELDGSGEPVFYNYSSGSASFTQVASAADIDETAHEWTFARAPDITFGGLIPEANFDMIPRDDPDTRASLWTFSYNDADFNNYWDLGETIYDVEIAPVIEGVIDMYNYDLGVTYPAGDPIAYYQYGLTSASVIPNTDLEEYVDPFGTTTVADLKTAIDAAAPEIRRPNFIPFFNNTEMYLSTPTEAAWHSLAPAGTVSTDPEGATVNSTGSLWWYLLNETHQ
jgi:hypothetical protein